MEQSQTPGDLVHHPDYDSKKALVDLKEALTLDGRDDSYILKKLREAHNVIQYACDACMITDEGDIKEFWHDRTFSRSYYYWLDYVKITMRIKGSSASEVSDAIKKARRALLAAREASTTDTEHAELLRFRNLKHDEDRYEDYVYGNIEEDSNWISRDEVAALQEHLISESADKSEIDTRLGEVEATIDRISSLCGFSDKDKQIFSRDIYGKFSADLLTLMNCRLERLGYDEVTVEEMVGMAVDAIRDAQLFFQTCMGGLSQCGYDVDELNNVRKRAYDTIEAAETFFHTCVPRSTQFSVSEITDAIKEARRAHFAAKEAGTTDTERSVLLRFGSLEDDENRFEDYLYEEIAKDPNWVSKDKVAALQEHLISVSADKSEIATRLGEVETTIQRIFSLHGFSDKDKQIFSRDINGTHSRDLLVLMRCKLERLGYDKVTIREMVIVAADAIRDAEIFFHTCMARQSQCGYDVDELSNVKKRAYDTIEAAEKFFHTCVPRHPADDEEDGGGSS